MEDGKGMFVCDNYLVGEIDGKNSACLQGSLVCLLCLFLLPSFSRGRMPAHGSETLGNIKKNGRRRMVDLGTH
jgi:hypothetical protein